MLVIAQSAVSLGRNLGTGV